jgi:hypothetical protein
MSSPLMTILLLSWEDFMRRARLNLDKASAQIR